MDDKTLSLTLTVSATLGFLCTLVIYASRPNNPNPLSSRVAFGIFVSVVPALGAFLVVKVTKLFVSRKWVVLIYLLLFLLIFSQNLVGLIIGANQDR